MINEEVASTLARLEGKIGEAHGKLDMIILLGTEDRKRLGSVERKVWYGSGLSAVIGIFLAKIGLPHFPSF